MVIAVALALYNFLRFGSIAEFGLRYQLTFEDPLKTTRFASRFLPYNLSVYWLFPARWTHFFPFVNMIRLPSAPAGYYGAEDPYGIIPNMPFALFALGLSGIAFGGWKALDRRLSVLIVSVLLVAVVMASFLALFQSAINRYMVDFTPWVMLVAALGLLVITAQRWFTGRRAKLATAVAVAVSLYSSFFGLMASQRHDEIFRQLHPEVYRRIASRWDSLVYGVDRALRTQYGPVEMRVVFPAGRAGAIEPLVVTGISFLADYLFVYYPAPDEVQFGLEHTSRGTLLGPRLRIAAGLTHIVRIEMGSLYPPPGHPYFDRMSREQSSDLQRTVRVTLDGRTALSRELDLYEGVGATPLIGQSGAQPGFQVPFSGVIQSWRRLPVSEFDGQRLRSGPMRISFELAPFSGAVDEPLVGLGTAPTADLLYLHREASDSLSFGYNHAGTIIPLGDPCQIKPDGVQVVEVTFDALNPSSPAHKEGDQRQGHLVVRLNGQSALDLDVDCFQSSPGRVSVGLNPSQLAPASVAFAGVILASGREDVTAPRPN